MILYCSALLRFSFSLMSSVLCVIFITLGKIRFFKNPNFCKFLY